MQQRSKSLMQSEIFIIIMIIIAMLYGITTMYAIKLKKENLSLKEQVLDPDYIDKLLKTIEELKSENKELKEVIKKLKEHIQKLQNKINDLKDEIKKLNIKIKDLENKIINLKDIIRELRSEIQTLKSEIKALKNEIIQLRFEIKRLDEELKNNKKPPLITLSEDEKDFRFGIGKAQITNNYKSALSLKTLPELIKNINDYDCNTIEIYGFTDTQPYNKNENIDDKLHNCISHECEIDKINIHSNLELGMKRAISIVNYLKQQQEKGLIRKNIVIKPYSAGQFIDEKGRVSTHKKSDNRKRRRIEIRLSRDKRVNESNTSK